MHRLTLALACALALGIGPARAQEFVFAIGTTDFGDKGTDSATFAVDYRRDPFWERGAVSLSFGAAATVSGEGDVFLGAGLAARWQWTSSVFVDASLMPGLYQEGRPGNDLGSGFQFRSLLGLGYRYNEQRAVSVAITHKSNAGLADDNPGANSYLLRYHVTF